MAYIFTQIHADIAPDLREKCLNCFPTSGFESSTEKFSSLLTNICKLTGANFVDGDNPKLLGSWHSIKDAYDLLTSLILQQNMINLLPAKHNSLTIDSFQFAHERPVCTQVTTQCIEREPKQMDRRDMSQLPQDTTQTLHQLQNNRFDSYNAQDKFPLTAPVDKLEMISLSRSEQPDHVPITDCDQPPTHSNTRRSVVIDFQDVNFETLQDFDHDQQQEALEHASNSHTTVQIKHEYDDEAYTTASEPHSSNHMSMTDHESPEQQPMFVMQNDGLSMHMKMQEGEDGDGNSGTEDFLDHSSSSQMPLYTTVSSTVLARDQESPSSCGASKVKKKQSNKYGSQHTHVGHGDNKLFKMFVKETSENGTSFVCINCKYNTYCLKNIEDHVRRNHSERLFHCSMCATKFGLKRDLKRHYKVKHCVIIDNNQKQNRLQKQ